MVAVVEVTMAAEAITEAMVTMAVAAALVVAGPLAAGKLFSPFLLSVNVPVIDVMLEVSRITVSLAIFPR